MASRKEKNDNRMNENKNIFDSEEEEIPTIDTRKARTVGPSTRGRGYAKDVNVSGLEYVHFGNTFVSYGVINVEGGQPPGRPQPKPDNLLHYLKLDDNLPYGNVNRTPRRSNFNNATRPPITITRRPINMRINPDKLDLHNEKKEKRKMYLLMSVYTILALLIIALLFVVYFGIGRKPVSPPNNPYRGETETSEPEKPIPRVFANENKDCISKFYKPYIKKTRLRFVVTKSLLYYCSNDDDEMSCFRELGDEYNFHKKNKFSDIYFNYIINSKGKVFHGRNPVECPFDEDFFTIGDKNTHEDIITVGIGYCFSDEAAGIYRKSDKEFSAIKKLVYYLKNTKPGRDVMGQLLENDVKLEFLEDCKESTLANAARVLGNVTFWKPDDTTPLPLKEVIYTGEMPVNGYFYKPGEDYRVIISELDTRIPFYKATCEEYFKELQGSSADYIVLLNGVHCQQQKETFSSYYTVKLLPHEGRNEVQSILIRSSDEWKKREIFLKTIWKLSIDMISKYGYKRVTIICKDRSESKYKVMYPIMALTFNGVVSDGEYSNVRYCPISNRHHLDRGYPSNNMFNLVPHYNR